jgi:hypothetical protein
MSLDSSATDAGPDLPLVPSLDRADGVERRACARALQWWRELAAPRRAPSSSQIGAAAAGELWPHLFLLRCAEDAADNRFEYAGAMLRSALGRDPTGLTLSIAWPGESIERALFLHKSCHDLLTPIDEAGRWNLVGEDIVYRCILMPLSDDQRRPSHLLGAFSFRRLAYA